MTPTTANPPGTAATAQFHSTSNYIATRPTGNAATMMMASLRNDANGTITSFDVIYDFTDMGGNGTTGSSGNSLGTPEYTQGHRVYHSASGDAGTWTPLGDRGANYLSNQVITISVTGLTWLPGSTNYLLFVDVNNQTNNDAINQIDNFQIANVAGGVVTCPGIINQPQNVTSQQCPASTATFSISFTGAVQGIQWYRSNSIAGFQPIPGANSATYTTPVNALGDDALFYATATNVQCGTTSTVASLTIAADVTPPSLLFSYVQTNLTNVLLFFSEAINTNNPDFYGNQILVDTNTSTQVATVAGQTYLNGSRVVLLYTDGTPLDPSHGYEITLSGIEDTCAANLAPDTLYPVGRLNEHVINFDTHEFKYDINNGDRTGTGWELTGFNDSAWPSGVQGLGHESDTAVGFPGNNAVPIRTHLNYASNAVVAYFRTHFTSPITPGANVGLILHDVVEDGAVYYLNGVELHRTRMPAGPVAFNTLANGAAEPQLITGPVFLLAPSLVAGDNVLAVAVHQSSVTSSDLEMAVDLTVVSPQPVAARPKLGIVRSGGVSTITWSGGGTLQGSLDISSPANWFNIPGASSPFVTNAPPGPAIQFFRVTVP